MPDRDIEHTELPPNYQTPYLQLLEGQDAESIAEEFERGLKQSLQCCGNAPVRFLHKARRIIGNASGPLFKNDDIQRKTTDKVEHLAARKLGNPHIEEIATEACKAALSPRIEAEWESEETADSVYYHYVKGLFETDAEGRIRNNPDQHPGKHDDICHLLDDVKAVMKDGAFSYLARQLCRGKDVEDLRVSPTPQIDGSGADLNLNEL